MNTKENVRETTSNRMNIEREIKDLKKRNARVELDKKWETSWTRRGIILLLTFIVVLIYNALIRSAASVWLMSMVPVIGFLLSTLSIDFIRKIWERRVK